MTQIPYPIQPKPPNTIIHNGTNSIKPPLPLLLVVVGILKTSQH